MRPWELLSGGSVTPFGLIIEVETLIEKGIKQENIIAVEPQKEYIAQGIKFETIPAYNINKMYHPKENGWVGYIININETKYYIAGDTDITPERFGYKLWISYWK